jgi:hypothetical protein
MTARTQEVVCLSRRQVAQLFERCGLEPADVRRFWKATKTSGLRQRALLGVARGYVTNSIFGVSHFFHAYGIAELRYTKRLRANEVKPQAKTKG